MRFTSLRKLGIGALLPLSAASTSFLSSLPHCWQSCISSNSPSCAYQDPLSCSFPESISQTLALTNIFLGICTLAGTTPSFLSSTSTCITNQCSSSSSNDKDPSTLLAPFQAACNANGTPIPSSSIGSRSLPSHSLDAADGTTTTTALASLIDSEGNTHTVAVPIMIGASTTEYGSPVTVGGEMASKSSTVVQSNISVMGLPKSTIPVVSSSSSSNPIAPLSTSTPFSSTTASSMTSSSTSTTSSTSSTSSSSKPPSSTTANSGSLLDLQGAGTRREARSLLGLILGVVAGVAWF